MLSTMTNSGRVAVVTGSNKGIGYFIALQLGLSGLFQHIILACRDQTLANAAAASMRSQLPPAVSVSTEVLTIGDSASHAEFANKVQQTFGKIDCLVNNSGFAFKNADPTPFKDQCRPTLNINFRGTVDFTEQMIPLLKKGADPRIVNVASMSGRLSQVSSSLQEKFSSDRLTMPELHDLIDTFERMVQDGTHTTGGYSNSNYGMSKLALIAATRILARENLAGGGGDTSIAVNCCCPGYCKTDMTSQKGLRDPADGARNAVIPATMVNPPTGALFADYQIAQW
jgi:carbonyl reductase 1